MGRSPNGPAPGCAPRRARLGTGLDLADARRHFELLQQAVPGCGVPGHHLHLEGAAAPIVDCEPLEAHVAREHRATSDTTSAGGGSAGDSTPASLTLARASSACRRVLAASTSRLTSARRRKAPRASSRVANACAAAASAVRAQAASARCCPGGARASERVLEVGLTGHVSEAREPARLGPARGGTPGPSRLGGPRPDVGPQA